MTAVLKASDWLNGQLSSVDSHEALCMDYHICTSYELCTCMHSGKFTLVTFQRSDCGHSERQCSMVAKTEGTEFATLVPALGGRQHIQASEF